MKAFSPHHGSRQVLPDRESTVTDSQQIRISCGVAPALKREENLRYNMEMVVAYDEMRLRMASVAQVAESRADPRGASGQITYGP
jgi:hypothetical protein